MSTNLHALSIDVEDFTSAAVLFACGRIVPPSCDVVPLTERMLALFGEYGAKATCFILGEVAEAYPALVRRIAAEGHELGVHGWHHHRIFQLDTVSCRSSLERAKKLLEDLSGRPVCGYRAVAMSITRSTWWAYDVLADLGFSYSSSIYPFRGKHYGVAGARLGPQQVATRNGSSVLEIPLSVVRVGPLCLPALGGGYLRHFPIAYSRIALRAIEKEGRRAVVYLHPYELDSTASFDSFPIPLSVKERQAVKRFVRGQYRNRHQTEAKVRWLLERARFASLGEAYGAELEQLAGAP